METTEVSRGVAKTRTATTPSSSFRLLNQIQGFIRSNDLLVHDLVPNSK